MSSQSSLTLSMVRDGSRLCMDAFANNQGIHEEEFCFGAKGSAKVVFQAAKSTFTSLGYEVVSNENGFSATKSFDKSQAIPVMLEYFHGLESVFQKQFDHAINEFSAVQI
ncbi:MAG: hypothetical protein K1X28_06945 [Parachlamydiales bacterium]|nr:hypothetical protein [Parachlamydiales bacterium]